MKNNKLPNFSDEHRDFIKECLVHDDSPMRVTNEFLDMYPDIGIGLDLSMEEIEDFIYQRIQKIKSKYKDEIEARKDDDTVNEAYEGMPYLSPKWRARYFRKLLRSVKSDDIDRQIKLLRELRAEEKLLNAARQNREMIEPEYDDLIQLANSSELFESHSNNSDEDLEK